MISTRIAFVVAASLAAASLCAASTAHAAQGAACIRAEAPGRGRLLAQNAPGMLALGRGTRMVRLEPVCGGDDPASMLSQRVASAPAHRRFLLVIEDLRAQAQPGVLFDLKLGSGRSDRGAFLGTLNFYTAPKPGVAARPRMVSYDVSQTVRALAAERSLEHGLVLAIQPMDNPAPNAGAAIGRIALVEQ